MVNSVSPRLRATLEALLVTFLWSSSYVLTKFGLTDIEPLTLAGLRYLVASVVLIPIALRSGEHRKISADAWWKLAVLGILGYTVAQGLQCVGLSYLPAVTVTLIVTAELILSAILDHFGLLGTEVRPMGLSRTMGMAVLLLGTWLMVR